MKFKYILVSCLLSILSYGDYININTYEQVKNLPPSVVIDGQRLFNPQKNHYVEAGWRPLIVQYVDRYSVVTNYQYNIITNGTGREFVQKTFQTVPLIVSKTPIILAAEQQYLSCWNAFFGSTNPNGYTNALREDVVIQIPNIAASNPQLYGLTHAMESSFNTIENWWTDIRGDGKFHPYPWGLTNDINVKEIITINVTTNGF